MSRTLGWSDGHTFVVLVLVVAMVAWFLREADSFWILDGANVLAWPEAFRRDRPTFYDTESIKWCAKMRAAVQQIRIEYTAALQRTQPPSVGSLMPEQSILSDWGASTTVGRWRVFLLRLYGRDTAVSGFPYTRHLLRTVVPGCVSAMFSVLDPGRRLVPHCGAGRGVLRYHLAIVVPHDPKRCHLTVLNERRHLSVGEDLLFDDTHTHTAHNESVDYHGLFCYWTSCGHSLVGGARP